MLDAKCVGRLNADLAPEWAVDECPLITSPALGRITDLICTGRFCDRLGHEQTVGNTLNRKAASLRRDESSHEHSQAKRNFAFNIRRIRTRALACALLGILQQIVNFSGLDSPWDITGINVRDERTRCRVKCRVTPNNTGRSPVMAVHATDHMPPVC